VVSGRNQPTTNLYLWSFRRGKNGRRCASRRCPKDVGTDRGAYAEIFCGQSTCASRRKQTQNFDEPHRNASVRQGEGGVAVSSEVAELCGFAFELGALVRGTFPSVCAKHAEAAPARIWMLQESAILHCSVRIIEARRFVVVEVISVAPPHLHCWTNLDKFSNQQATGSLRVRLAEFYDSVRVS
jgi:hypothetical protein